MAIDKVADTLFILVDLSAGAEIYFLVTFCALLYFSCTETSDSNAAIFTASYATPLLSPIQSLCVIF